MREYLLENLVARAGKLLCESETETMWSAHLNVGKVTITTAFLFVVYVINKQRERERERERERDRQRK
jgi:hypothetical protein